MYQQWARQGRKESGARNFTYIIAFTVTSWIVSSPKSYAEDLTPGLQKDGIWRVFKEVINLKWGDMGGALIQYDDCFVRRN